MEGKESGRDAEVVAKLRAAGALIIGTANLHELAFGVTSANANFGQSTRRTGPYSGWIERRLGRGVAASLATIGIGTDTGGSIRVPAACCGGRLRRPRCGQPRVCPRMDVDTSARSHRCDAALAFEVMAGLPAGCVSGKPSTSRTW
jgi:aspartyl-tRNA(Asn)/glutamyl-tRNA(Gln) amidotransferase subunit A